MFIRLAPLLVVWLICIRGKIYYLKNLKNMKLEIIRNLFFRSVSKKNQMVIYLSHAIQKSIMFQLYT